MNKMNYIPLHVHTGWSLLDSTVDINEYVSLIAELGGSACAITDHNNIKGLVPFFKACKNKKIKPIFGCELDIWQNGSFLGRITLIAKNKTGYKNLVSIVSIARSKERVFEDGKPKSYLNELHQFSSGIICLIGDLRSEIFTSSYANPEMAYMSNSEEECQALIRKDWADQVNIVLAKYRKVFSEAFLFFDYSKLPCLKVLGSLIKDNFKEAIPCNNVHYLKKEDIPIHKMILSSKEDPCGESDERIFDENFAFCHLPKLLPNAENSIKILELIEDFTIEERPMIPEFKINGHTVHDQDEYLRNICRKGFSEKILPKISGDDELKTVYLDRIKHELSVFKQAKISGYFLIVKDIVDFIRSNGFPDAFATVSKRRFTVAV